ncbi:oxidoreductase [Aspergillus taichungensis]|uniref:Oxidoreductase n=1 Tax=Aspergillus taichungensis TaxID=482145 RepID=A0A2J5I4G9_9EURO|nr:oxidoreductase [Aspergillus taichungensis]
MTTATYTISSLEKPSVVHKEIYEPHDRYIARDPIRRSPSTQRALLLQAAREQYTLVHDHAIPDPAHGEILVKIVAIGLNPVDWKGPAFNFGIPRLPWINGRDLAGIVVSPTDESSRVQQGDLVLVPSTDYRDIRKAAFQEYAIATVYNAARIPSSQCVYASASLGVAFVASVLALGVSFGIDFSKNRTGAGPDLARTIRGLSRDNIPADILDETFSCTLPGADRAQPGDWLAIWGASTTTGYITLQLAKLAGLHVICVADVAAHGRKLHSAGADILIDRRDPERAVEIIRGVTGGRLRYAIDFVGRETATLLERTLDATNGDAKAHLLGLTGLPKDRQPGIAYHTVPIKLFHLSPEVGESMVVWLESLLRDGTLRLPEIVRSPGGLGSVNASLEMLKDGTASGKRVVVDLE